jgi:hypothetical protein
VAAIMSFRADERSPVHPDQPQGTEHAIAEGEPDGDADLDRLPARVTEEVIRRQIDSLRRQLDPEEPDPAAAPVDEASPEKPADAGALEDVMRSTAERVQSFAHAVAQDVVTGWGQLSPEHRLILTGSAGIGLAAGIILGVVLPAWAAGLVTALLGAGVWLSAATWLALAVAAPGSEHLERRRANGSSSGSAFPSWE